MASGNAALAAPQRVVSTFLCTDEYVYRLVPREHIAALSVLAADTHPVVSTIYDKVKGVPLVHPSAEEILLRKPDLVVMYEGTNPRLHQLLANARVRILDVPWADSLADVRKVTLLLGSRLGAEARADALLANMDAALARARRNAPARPVRALIYEPNGYATSGAVTDELMHAAGLTDIAQSLGMTRLGTVPVEAVVSGAPELVILNGAARTVRARADLVLHHPALQSLAGGRTVVAAANLTPLLCPGPWSVDAVTTFTALGRKARALAPHLPRS